MNRRSLLPAALLAVALGAGSSAAMAQSVELPRQSEFYFDADAATVRPVLELKERTPAAVDRLTRTVERRPEAVLETAQLAHYAMQGGQNDVGGNLYSRALARIDLTNGLWKPVKWNYGWDLYRAGDAEGALQQWSEIGSRGVTASWMPTTYALALWKLGRKDEAVRWYAAAVRTEPTQWSTSAQYAELLPQWRDDERATLAEVQAAWAANPPKWP
ncbi:tetratricopeptide repeat protein [Lysobacter claricitrinus]|uniref:tetratricopeptide repeat protein n=1 Tax=Lysobacter claricitrinus TaxID=3367728 RepID=UPI0038B3B2EF